MNLHSWLRRIPIPSKVVLDQKRTVQVGQGKTKWRDVLEVIENVQPTLIEALDAEGHVLRVTNLNPTGEAETEKQSEARKDETQLVQIARLLNEAHEAGAKRHEAAYRIGYDKMSELVTAFSERATNLEAAWVAMLNQHAQTVVDHAEELAEKAGEGEGDGITLGKVLELGAGLAGAAAKKEAAKKK